MGEERKPVLLDGDVQGQVEASSAEPAPARGPGSPALLEQVTRAFPALVVNSSRIERCGGDHLVLIVNEDEYAFRFPRAGVHDLRFEIAVLRHLRHCSPVAVPVYDHIDPAGWFAGYPYLRGVSLTRERFARLNRAQAAAVLDAAAAFLTAPHRLPQSVLAWPGDCPKAWTASQFADRGLSERLPLICHHVPQLAAAIEAFLTAYRLDHSEHLAIVHGDLVCEHMLIDQAGSRFSGVIDFGDVALGDPAQDLLGFWSYGPYAVAHVVSVYDPFGDDPDLLRRSRNHFIRYRIDQLFECLDTGERAGAPAHIATVTALLNGFDT